MCQLQPTKQKESIPNILRLYLSKNCQVLLIASQFWHQTICLFFKIGLISCVPTFTFNLISITKLTHNLSCCIIFLSNYCFIQDHSLWMMIGLRKERERWSIHSAETKLYLPHCIINCHCTNACCVCCQQLILSLWHCRLGHPSFSRIGHYTIFYHLLMIPIMRILIVHFVLQQTEKVTFS